MSSTYLILWQSWWIIISHLNYLNTRQTCIYNSSVFRIMWPTFHSEHSFYISKCYICLPVLPLCVAACLRGWQCGESHRYKPLWLIIFKLQLNKLFSVWDWQHFKQNNLHKQQSLPCSRTHNMLIMLVKCAIAKAVLFKNIHLHYTVNSVKLHIQTNLFHDQMWHRTHHQLFYFCTSNDENFDSHHAESSIKLCYNT